MVHDRVNCQEDMEQVVTRTTTCGVSRGRGDTTVRTQKGKYARGTVTVAWEGRSDWRGGEGPTLAHAGPGDAPPLESSLKR